VQPGGHGPLSSSGGQGLPFDDVPAAQAAACTWSKDSSSSAATVASKERSRFIAAFFFVSVVLVSCYKIICFGQFV
jgi:hypothetical protein